MPVDNRGGRVGTVPTHDSHRDRRRPIGVVAMDIRTGVETGVHLALGVGVAVEAGAREWTRISPATRGTARDHAAEEKHHVETRGRTAIDMEEIDGIASGVVDTTSHGGAVEVR